MINEKVKLGNLEISLDELAGFLVEAKLKGYAGGGEYMKAKDGSKVFTFQEGDFHYEDRFWGSSQAPGRELVRWQREDGQGLWFMSYCGGMLPEFHEDEELSERTFAFLKKMLSKVTPEQPFRGPSADFDEEFNYMNVVDGDIKRFSGEEYIDWSNFDKNESIFSQDYIGGLIIP